MKYPNIIYGYIEPRKDHPKSGKIRYTGSDQRGGERMMDFAGHDHGYVGPWIKELRAEGLVPEVVILCQTNWVKKDLFELENNIGVAYDTFNDLNFLKAGVFPPNMKGTKWTPERKAAQS